MFIVVRGSAMGWRNPIQNSLESFIKASHPKTLFQRADLDGWPCLWEALLRNPREFCLGFQQISDPFGFLEHPQTGFTVELTFNLKS